MARPRAWADRLVQVTLVDAALMTPLDLLEDLPNAAVKTVSRVIGAITIVPSSTSATSDYVSRIDVGIGVVSAEAFVAGVVPDPQTQADSPTLGWLYRTRLVSVRQNASGTLED